MCLEVTSPFLFPVGKAVCRSSWLLGEVREGSGSCGRCGSSSGVSRQLEYRDTAGGPRNSSSFSLHPCSCLLTGPSGRARAPRPAGEPGGSGKDKPPPALLGKTGEENSAPEMGGTSTRNWLEEPFPAQNLPADTPRVGSPSSAGNLLGQGTSCVLIFNTPLPRSSRARWTVGVSRLFPWESCCPSWAEPACPQPVQLSGHFIAPHKTLWG